VAAKHKKNHQKIEIWVKSVAVLGLVENNCLHKAFHRIRFCGNEPNVPQCGSNSNVILRGKPAAIARAQHFQLGQSALHASRTIRRFLPTTSRILQLGVCC